MPTDGARPEIRLAAPTWRHPFGTDDIGRDVLSRVIHGARISLWVGLAVGIDTAAGMVIGLLCGYCEGRVDLVFQRLRHPGDPRTGARARHRVRAPAQHDECDARDRHGHHPRQLADRPRRRPGRQAEPVRRGAQAIGCRHPRIILSHILPNVTAPILIIASIWFGNAILIEATQLPRRRHAAADAVMGADAGQHRPGLHGAGAVAGVFPGLAISVAVLGFNLFGDTLRDAWDPKLRKG